MLSFTLKTGEADRVGDERLSDFGDFDGEIFEDLILPTESHDTVNKMNSIINTLVSLLVLLIRTLVGEILAFVGVGISGGVRDLQ